MGVRECSSIDKVREGSDNNKVVPVLRLLELPWQGGSTHLPMRKSTEIIPKHKTLHYRRNFKKY